MENKKLYIIVGKSATGKDTVVDKICKEFNLKKVISRTTRLPRYVGEDTHVFVPYAEGEYDWNTGKALVKQYVQNKDRQDMYYVTKDDLIGKDFYILFPTGVKSFEEAGIDNYEILYLKIPFFTRLKRIIKRGDSKLGILKRFLYEIKEFWGFKCQHTFYSTDEMYYYLHAQLMLDNIKRVNISKIFADEKSEKYVLDKLKS